MSSFKAWIGRRRFLDYSHRLETKCIAVCAYCACRSGCRERPLRGDACRSFKYSPGRTSAAESGGFRGLAQVNSDRPGHRTTPAAFRHGGPGEDIFLSRLVGISCRPVSDRLIGRCRRAYGRRRNWSSLSRRALEKRRYFFACASHFSLSSLVVRSLPSPKKHAGILPSANLASRHCAPLDIAVAKCPPACKGAAWQQFPSRWQVRPHSFASGNSLHLRAAYCRWEEEMGPFVCFVSQARNSRCVRACPSYTRAQR